MTPTRPFLSRAHSGAGSIARSLLLAFLLSTSAVGAAEASDWSPTVSERLIRLPSAYLDRAIEQDFARSGLAAAIAETERRIEDNAVAVDEFGRAAEEASDVATEREARHRTLLAKQSYVRLMGERLDLRRKRLETEVRLLEALSRKLARRSLSEKAATAAVTKDREEALERFERNRTTIDARLLKGGLAPDSRYAADYDRNLAAIRQLSAAIAAHPANTEGDPDAPGLSTEEHLRRRLAEAETARALLTQEEKVLGYMAKLVSLDALAFAEEVDLATATVDGKTAPADLATAAELFIRR